MASHLKKPGEKEKKIFLETVNERFEKNYDRHKGCDWSDILKRLEANPGKLVSLYYMEQTGGEPDIVIAGSNKGDLMFFDCSAETPSGRRNTCYDSEGQAEREKKGINPTGNAVGMASDMGIELLDEEKYRMLQTYGEFDLKTSSWILTPDDIRKKGGALFCDRRYGHVFLYHNSAPSFYSSRGFRGWLKI